MHDESYALEAENAELQSAVLDLHGEDQDAMKSQQRQWHWDARKKRYVQQTGSDATARGRHKKIKTESGKTVEAGKGGKGLYQKWVKHNKVSIAAAGTMESGPNADDLAGRFKPSQRHKSWKTKGQAPVRGGELKTKEQISKERRKKTDLQQRMQERQKANAAKSQRAGKRKGGKGERR